MGVQYIDEAGDLQYYKWYRNPIKWLTYAIAWRRLIKRIKVGGPIDFTGANKIVMHDYEVKK